MEAWKASLTKSSKTSRSTTTAAAVARTVVESKSLDEILRYKNEEVIARFRRDNPEHAARAEILFQDMLTWLWACSQHELIVTPELIPMDEMWHAFILHTREYERFCTEMFGKVIHHDPLPEAKRAEFEALRERDPKAALAARQNELRPQLEYLYGLLGPETLKRWYLA